MVNAQALLEEVEEGGFDADLDDEITDEISGSNANTDAPDDADPLAELRETISELKEFSKRFSDFDPLSVKRELGHIRSIQSRLDSLSNANPLEAINPRVDGLEEVIGSLIEGVLDSDLYDDTTKASIRSSRERLVNSKTEREWQRREQELLSKVSKAAEPEQSAQADPWMQATSDVLAEAAELYPDFDVKTVPQEIWTGGVAKGTPARAVAHVLRWIEQNHSAPTEQLARRKQTTGSRPERRAAGQSDVEKYESYGRGEIDLKNNELVEIEKRLKEQGIIK